MRILRPGRFSRLASAVGALLANSLAGAPAWTLNTFPGEAHRREAGPWGDGQGSDRAEWVSAFGVSPLVAPGEEFPLQLMATDIGGLVQCLDGREFTPAPVPLKNGVAVAFSPHDGRVAFASLHFPFQSSRCEWWRTNDRGLSWFRLTEASYVRGQRRQLQVDPRPARAAHLYLATTAGVRRSLDDGATWAVLPETAGLAVQTLKFNADGSALFVIDAQQTAHRLDLLDDAGNYRWTAGLRPLNTVDLEPHPVDPDRGVLIDLARRVWWYRGGDLVAEREISPAARGWNLIRVNPGNPNHLVLTKQARISGGAFTFSLDGGTTWQASGTVVRIDGRDYVDGWRDWSPYNHGSPGGLLVERFETLYEGARDLLAFWPGQSSTVVHWGTNKQKAPLRSLDGGATHQPYAHGGSFKEATMMALGARDDVQVISRVEYGLVTTTDGGLSWRGLNPHNEPLLSAIQGESQGPSWLTSTAHGVAVNPLDENDWIATYGHRPAWVIRTRDAGRTWARVAPFDLDVQADAEDFTRRWVWWPASRPALIYAGTLRSTDGGETWSPLPARRAVTEIHPANGEVVLHRQLGARIFASFDAGTTWSELPAARGVNLAAYTVPNGRHPGCFAIDPDPARDPTVPGQRLRLLVGGRQGAYVFEATNASASTGVWTRITAGLDLSEPLAPPGAHVFLSHAVFDPRPGRHRTAYLAAGMAYTNINEEYAAYRRQIYRSEDGGLSWSRISADPAPAYVQVTAPLVVSPTTGRLFANTWSGLLRYDPTPPVPFIDGAFDEGDGWWTSAWFGRFFESPDHLGWLFHQGLGWLRVEVRGADLLVRHPGRAEWWATRPNQFPWVRRLRADGTVEDWALLDWAGPQPVLRFPGGRPAEVLPVVP